MSDEPRENDFIQVTCIGCHKTLRVPRRFAGRYGRCPRCETKFRIPDHPKKKELVPPALTLDLAKGKAEEEDDTSFAVVLPWWEEFVERMKTAGPCWLVSFAVHAALLILLAAVTLSVPSRDDEGIRVNVQLKAEEGKQDVYLAKEDIQKNLDQMLPKRDTMLMPQMGGNVNAPTAGMGQGPDLSGAVAVIGVRGTTPMGGSLFAVTAGPVSFFGSSGGKEVSSVVFVVDRSASMEGERLATAKEELRRSVQRLTVGNMFNVIFFHDPGDHKVCWPGMKMALSENKEHCYSFIEGIAAAGGTNPTSAMEVAIRSKPDLIYLLTDGEFEQGQMAVGEIRDLMRRYAIGKKVRVNTIAFKSRLAESVLKQIADMTGGTYRFVR